MKLPPLREKPRQARRLPPEQLAGVRHVIHRATGLRADLTRLSSDEANELYALVQDIRRHGDVHGVEATSPAYLDKPGQARWEALVAKACAVPDNHFAEQRRLAAEADKADKAARAPNAHTTRLEPGATVLPASMWHGLANGDWTANHLLITTVVLIAVQNRAPLHRRMVIEDGGVVVVPSPESLIAPLDPDGDTHGIARALKELALGGILHVERSNGETRIRLGHTLTTTTGTAR